MSLEIEAWNWAETYAVEVLQEGTSTLSEMKSKLRTRFDRLGPDEDLKLPRKLRAQILQYATDLATNGPQMVQRPLPPSKPRSTPGDLGPTEMVRERLEAAGFPVGVDYEALILAEQEEEEDPI